MAAKFDWKKHKGYVIAGVVIVAGIYIWYNSKSSSVGFNGWNNVGGRMGGGDSAPVTANNITANSTATTMAVNPTGGSGTKNYIPTTCGGGNYHHEYGGGVDNIIIDEPYLEPYVYSEMNPMYCNGWMEQWNSLYMRLTVIPPMQANSKNPLAVSLVNDLNRLTYTMQANGCGMTNPIITITNTAIIFN